MRSLSCFISPKAISVFKRVLIPNSLFTISVINLCFDAASAIDYHFHARHGGQPVEKILKAVLFVCKLNVCFVEAV